MNPALLPGLLGMGVAALRKKRKEASEQVAETVEA
ncbi:MAG: PTPA-CTERM sorting domain-containing protein [Leptolyngbya sp. BL-A-14]